jgi:RNA polymerase sigma-70 factor (ECF subfamily)
MADADALETAPSLSRDDGLTYARRMDHGPDDSALMLRYADGDVEAFERLYRRHNDALYRYLLHRCRRHDVADDLFQEVWGKVIRARSRYRPTAKFSTYLYRIAHNCFVDHWRRSRHDRQIVDIDPDSQADSGGTVAAEAERSLARRRLEQALAALPDEQRDVFLLAEEAQLSLDDIAFVTGVKRETAKSRLRYAVRKLKTALGENADALREAT